MVNAIAWLSWAVLSLIFWLISLKEVLEMLVARKRKCYLKRFVEASGEVSMYSNLSLDNLVHQMVPNASHHTKPFDK